MLLTHPPSLVRRHRPAFIHNHRDFSTTYAARLENQHNANSPPRRTPFHLPTIRHLLFYLIVSITRYCYHAHLARSALRALPARPRALHAPPATALLYSLSSYVPNTLSGTSSKEAAMRPGTLMQ
jgi:hypothetical protein